MGMCLGRKGRKDKKTASAVMNASVIMTSTCHRVHGPMAKLIEQAEAGATSRSTRCASSRSSSVARRSGRGPKVGDSRYLNCPDLPDQTLLPGRPEGCRAQGQAVGRALPDRLPDPEAATTGTPGLRGRLPLQALVERGGLVPPLPGETHVSEEAEYDPGLPVHLAVDTGVFTGAVFFQIVLRDGDRGPDRGDPRLRRLPLRRPIGRGQRPGDPGDGPQRSMQRGSCTTPRPTRPATRGTRSARRSWRNMPDPA